MPANIVEIILRAKDEAAKTFKDTEGRMQSLGRTATKMGGIMMAAGGAAVGAMVGITVKTAQAGDELAKLSIRTGISVEKLSELKHVAELNDATLGGFARGMKILATNMLYAEQGMETYTRVFNEAGVSWKDGRGNLKELDKMFEEIADAIAAETNETKQAALATQLLGRGGIELLPVLKLGAEGIRAQREEAKALGLVFTTEAAKASEQFNDDLTRLKGTLKGVGKEIAISVLPMLTNLIQQGIGVGKVIVQWAQAHSTLFPMLLKLAGFVAVGGTLLVGMGLIIKIAPLMGAALASAAGPIGLLVGALSAVIARFYFLEEFAKAMDEQIKSMPRVSSEVREMAKSNEELRKKLAEVLGMEGVITEMREKHGRASRDLMDRYMKARQELDSMVLSLKLEKEERDEGAPVLENEAKAREKVLLLIKSSILTKKEELKFRKALTAATGEQIQALAEEIATLHESRKAAYEAQVGLQDFAEASRAAYEAERDRRKQRREKEPELREVPLVETILPWRVQYEMALLEIQAITYSVKDAVVGAAMGIANAFQNAFMMIGQQGTTFARFMMSLISGMVRAIQAELAKLIAFEIFKKILTAVGLPLPVAGGGKVPSAALGGKVTGFYPIIPFPKLIAQAGGKLYGGIPGRDSIPFLGMPGEVILPTRLVKQLEQVFTKPAGRRAQEGGVVTPGRGTREIHHHYHLESVIDATSLRRMIRSGELGEELRIAMTRGDL